MTKILITGAAGFIGSHLVEYLLRNTDWHITVIDRLDGSGNLHRLSEIGCPDPRVTFRYHDLKAPLNDTLLHQIGEHDYIAHLAAATHVDDSIADPLSFVMDNVVATANMLDYARKTECKRFLQFSTDEVFGPAPKGMAYKEDDRYRSGNPYAATKAGAEELAIAYHNTYRLPVMVTHTMNVIGPRQHYSKFLPQTIGKIHNGQTVKIHADPTCKIPGSRFYIHARNVADAVYFLFNHGKAGEKYNIVGEREMDNLELANQIAVAMRLGFAYELVNFHQSRPGHDLRYALDGSKLRAMGWRPPETIAESIQTTVGWYLRNPHWLPDMKRWTA